MAAMREGVPRKARTWEGKHPWMVARHAHVTEVLRANVSADVRNPDFPHTSPGQAEVEGGGLHRSDGDDHRRLRKTVQGPINAKNAEAMRPKIVEIIESKIDALLDHDPPVDFVEVFAAAVPSTVICEVLGVPYEEGSIVHDAMEHLASLSASQEDKQTAIGQLGELISKHLEIKRDEPDDKLLSRLIEKQVEPGNISMEEAVRVGVLAIGAGHHTTVSMLAFGTLSLILDEEQRRLVLDGGAEVAATATNELLRYWSITHTEPRRIVLEDLELGGQKIAVGEAVVCSLGAANRDPEVFGTDDGSLDELNVCRHTAGRHIAFGFGPHQCLGQHLTRVEMQEAFPRLFTRIPDLRLAITEDELDFDDDALTRGLKSMPVTWGSD
jgi:cytochrome P450